MSRFANRCDALRKLLRQAKLPALLVQKETNVRYLTGFTGEDSILLVTPKAAILLTDSRFETQLADECPNLELYVRKTRKKVETMDEAVAAVLKATHSLQCGLEGESMTIGFRERVDGHLKSIQWATTRGLVEELRMIKDKQEIDETRVAVRLAEEAFQHVTSRLRPDQTEKEVADALEMHIRQQGGKGTCFEPIVAVGPRAALPHGRAGNALLSAHHLVLIDWGATARHYKSDLTRVIFTGKISPKLERVYQVVLKAQLAAIAAIRPGVACETVDQIARGTIEKAGFGKFFGHGLGHGIGMDVHEGPGLRPGSKTVLRPGMIVTVEPGIYLPNVGGVRIEDDVLVTRSGHEVLSSLPKRFDECRVSF